MNIGIFLAIGESFGDLAQKGQLKRLTNYNIRTYSKVFDNVYIFSYANEKKFPLPKNCYLLPNTSGLHRYLYAIMLPIIWRGKIAKCDILRGLQLSGGIPAAIAKVIYGKKFVINYGYDYSKFAKIEKKPFQSFLYKIIEEPVLKLATSVIVTSRHIKRDLARVIKAEKIYYIPNGVDTRLFRKINYKKNPKLTILFIGRFEKQKNLENLIQALSGIKNSRALFFGRGLLKNNLKSLARKFKVDLTINKPVDYKNVPKILSSADIFVLPSLEEGNPKILLEAMATQKCVVGTNVKGISEIIEDNVNGILTEPESPSIAKALMKLKDKNLREKLGKNARDFIIKNYEISALLNKEVNLMKKIATTHD